MILYASAYTFHKRRVLCLAVAHKSQESHTRKMKESKKLPNLAAQNRILKLLRKYKESILKMKEGT